MWITWITNLLVFQLAIIKHRCDKEGGDDVVIQDSVSGQGGGLEAGDSAELRYTGWLLENNLPGQVSVII